MKQSPAVLNVGTRSSELALIQTRSVIRQCRSLAPQAAWQEVPFTTPGDRDLATDLRESPADFFTRDLDQALLAGTIDCAIHSAKDLPGPVPEGLDWCWLPWREDPRDALIRPIGKGLDTMPPEGRIGVSSARRDAYCLRRFPSARLAPVRGAILQRLKQLDDGDFDLLLMAGAALVRLGLERRITEWIPLEDLPPPDGQGVLAMTFRAGDERFLLLRRRFVRAVTFAAAGVGSAGACTLDNLHALQRCEVCLHDVLLGRDLLELLPPAVRCVDVGKRCGQHSVPQDEITSLITVHARRGQRVVRLKGGDPGIFGRLAEEVAALDALRLPYRVLPGVSSLNAATTGTGMLLTRRGVSRGFTVMTPRKEGGGLGSVAAAERAKLPIVFFMAVSAAGEVASQLIADGMAPQTPAAAVFGAGSDQMKTVRSDLSGLAARLAEAAGDLPGLLIVGEAASYAYGDWGALEGRRVLLTASRALQDKAAGLVSDYGGVPVCRPLIRLVASPEGLEKARQLDRYDWVVLTSPSAVRVFGELLAKAGVDVRSVPRLVSCGEGTSREMKQTGYVPFLDPPADFGGDALLAAVRPHVAPGLRVLRLRSDKAGPELAEALRGMGATVDDCVLYLNEPIRHETRPEFDVVFFASASAVEAFDAQWGTQPLEGKFVVAIGKPTLAALKRRRVRADLVAPEATVEATIEALAEHCVREALAGHLGDASVLAGKDVPDCT